MFEIILPTTGRETLSEAIESVLCQSFKDWRLWVCYDLPYRPAFKQPGLPQDKRINFLCTGEQHNDSGAAARNFAIHRSITTPVDEECIIRNTPWLFIDKYPWLTYLDDDDIWLPHHLETLREYLDTPRILRTWGWMTVLKRKRKARGGKYRKRKRLHTNDVLTPGMCHTKDIFFKTNGWQPCDNHDRLLWDEMVKAGAEPHVIEEATFEYLRGKRR